MLHRLLLILTVIPASILCLSTTHHFGSKSPYPTQPSPAASLHSPVLHCRVTSVALVSRHGSRFPTAKHLRNEAKFMEEDRAAGREEELLGRLKGSDIRNAKDSSKCEERSSKCEERSADGKGKCENHFAALGGREEERSGKAKASPASTVEFLGKAKERSVGDEERSADGECKDEFHAAILGRERVLPEQAEEFFASSNEGKTIGSSVNAEEYSFDSNSKHENHAAELEREEIKESCGNVKESSRKVKECLEKSKKRCVDGKKRPVGIVTVNLGEGQFREDCVDLGCDGFEEALAKANEPSMNGKEVHVEGKRGEVDSVIIEQRSMSVDEFPAGENIVIMETVKTIINTKQDYVSSSATADIETTYLKGQPGEGLFTRENEGLLTTKGKEEMFELGKRMSVWVGLGEYHPRRVEIRSSQITRAVESASSFAAGMFGSIRGVVIVSDPVDVDLKLRFHDNCLKYSKHKKKYNAPVLLQHSILQKLKDKVAPRIGLASSRMTDKHLEHVWNSCRFEATALNVWDKSCALFDDEDAKLLEYVNDVKDYWEKGFGRDINYDMACVLLRDVVEGLETKKFKFLFGHAETIMPLIGLLGLYKDDAHLGMDFEKEFHSRKWRSGIISPFAANIAFVRKQCDGVHAGDVVQILHNERPMNLSHLCPGSTDPMFCSFLDFIKALDSKRFCKFQEVCLV